MIQRTLASVLSVSLILLGVPAASANQIVVAPVAQSAGIGGQAGAAVRPVSLAPGSLTPSFAAGATLGGSLQLPSVPKLTPVQGLTPSAPVALPAAARTRAASAVSDLTYETPGLQIVTAESAGSVTDDLSPRLEAVPQHLTSSVRRDAAPEQKTEDPRRPFRRFLSRISGLLQARGALFDGEGCCGGGTGILPLEPEHTGVRLDPAPAQPAETEIPRLNWNMVHMPGPRPTGLRRLFTRSLVRAYELPGDPRTAEAVESALRSLIASDPEHFGGLRPGSLETVISQKVAGLEGLPDTVYVGFRQTLNGLQVDGSYLNFTIKLMNGKAVVMGSSAQLYPTLSLDVFGRLSDSEIIRKALERLGAAPQAAQGLQRIGRRIMHIDGKWRSVYLVFSQDKTLIAAVDVNTGEAMAWDPRMSMAHDGEVKGRGVEFDPANTKKLDVMPMANIELKTSDGRVFYADREGYFTYEAAPEAGEITVTARLAGKYARVEDQARKDLKVTATLKPGERVRIVFNPVGAGENSTAQVTAYRHVNKVHDWLMARGIDVSAIHRPMPTRVNINRDCNAYYTPWSPSLNFFQSSDRCLNTAYDTVIHHEYGHFVDDMIGGIVNSGLSEGWGDTLSLYITGQPVLGEGFLKKRDPSYIRHGENKYQYSARDEVHAQGQAWGGFNWKLRRMLIESLLEAGMDPAEAEKHGAALAENLVIPVFFANVRSIPAAIEAVLLRDVGEDGRAAHFKQIQAAARAHGIEVKEPRPGEMSASYVRAGWFRRLTRFVESVIRAFSGG